MPHFVDDSGASSVGQRTRNAHSTPRSGAAAWGFVCVLYVVFDSLSHGMFDVQLAPLISLTMIAVLIALVLALSDGRAGRIVGRRGGRVTTMLLVVFVTYTSLSAVLGRGTFNLGFVKALLLFAAVVALADGPGEFGTLLLVAGSAGLVQAGLGVRQMIVAGGVPPGGVTGLLPNHVQYAVYLLLSAIVLAPFVHSILGARRIALVLAEAFLGVVIVVSLARGVLVAAIACAIVWLLLATRSTRERLLAGAGITAAALSALVASQRLGTLLEIPGALSDPARLNVLLSGRLPLLLAAWNMWLAHPLLGVGYGRFPAVWDQYVPAGIGIPGILRLELATHSTYLQIAAEMGIVGLGLYIALMVSGLRDAWKARAESARMGDALAALMSAAVFVGLIAISVHGLLDNTGWHDRPFYILLGAAVAMRAWTVRETADEGGVR